MDLAALCHSGGVAGRRRWTLRLRRHCQLRDATGWLAEYRRFWDDSLERLDDYLQALQAAPEDQSRDN